MVDSMHLYKLLNITIGPVTKNLEMLNLFLIGLKLKKV